MFYLQTAVVNVPSLAPGLALSYTLIRLQPYTEYTVNVTCGINNFDFGKFAGPVTATTLEEGKFRTYFKDTKWYVICTCGSVTCLFSSRLYYICLA